MKAIHWSRIASAGQQVANLSISSILSLNCRSLLHFYYQLGLAQEGLEVTLLQNGLKIRAVREKEVSDLAAQLNKKLEPEPRSYAKLIEGETLRKNGKISEAITLFKEAKALIDTQFCRFALGQGFLDAAYFTEADSEFELCQKRRGETASLFLNDFPSYWYLPQIYYYLDKAQ